ncbi:substrate-binding periplasmic protein [Psychromonas hadalis]|uniref:substrate-binding periplasmic protein n=1 Tax=Psychromonas hadalis TaxID=211669 RepID=UPI0003B300C1|nr:transporter substrate-binding domain-containing protein [Psychromonas hadalis]
MRKIRVGTFVVLLVCMVFPAISSVVSICSDSAEWPPYTFYPRNNGKIDKSMLTGATYDAIELIFKQAGMSMKMKMIPWKRCLQEVKNYTEKGNFEIFIDGSSNKKRMSQYIRTNPFYQMNQGLFYSTKKYPSGPDIKKVTDLNNFKVCGVAGYSYEQYQKKGLTVNIDTGTKSSEALLKKLSAGRCDIFLSSIEPIIWGGLIGQFTLTADIKYSLLDEISKTKFYAWISKGSPRANQLVDTINKGLKTLKENGELETIFKTYLPTGTGF